MLKTRAGQLPSFIVLAALLGGGGVAYGIQNLLIQLAALGLLAVYAPQVGQFVRTGPRWLVGLMLASILLPLIQLVPLPPGVWTAMPGRDAVQESLQAAGGLEWFATSVNSSRTFVAFLGLIAPFTLIALGWRSEGNAIGRITLAFIAMGIVNVALGTLQVLGTNQFAVPYAENEVPGVLFGLFANRNSTGIYLVCCLILLVTLPRVKLVSAPGLAKAASAALLVVGVVLTQSRTSIVLLALPLALTLLRQLLHVLAKQRSPGRAATDDTGVTSSARITIAASIALLALAAGLAPMLAGTRLDSVMSRFEKTDDERSLIWEDARYSAERYWPVGSGMATFDEVFQSDESLENLSQRRAGRAHNDYIEIVIEAGVIGAAVVFLWALWIAWATWTALGSPRMWPALGGAGILLAIALQSALDYPLRNQTMLCLAAFAVLLIAPVHSARSRSARQEEDRP